MLTLDFLRRLAEAHHDDLDRPVRGFNLRGTRFSFGDARYLMGVVNLSPESWYRESVCLRTDQAVRRGITLAAQGAHLVDIGAESTLGHAPQVEPSLQTSRLLPVIRALAAKQILVSVETYQPEVTRACLEAGAAVLNLTGTQLDDSLLGWVRDHDAALILCHVQGDHVRAVADFAFTADPVASLYEFFARQTDRALAGGVERIFIDPGLGFYYRNLQDSATRIRHQMGVFLNSFRLRRLGFPVCHALPHAFEHFGEEVRCAEPFFAVVAALGQTDLFRTHEVAKTRAVLETLSATATKAGPGGA